MADRIGRLTFIEDFTAATMHLHKSAAPYVTYNLTNSGEPASWAGVARQVYEYAGRRA